MKIVIIGAGGFGREVAWTAKTAGHEVIGFCDDAEVRCDMPFLGSVEQAAERLEGASFLVAVGSNSARRRLFERAKSCGWKPLSVVSPAATVAPDVEIGEGTYIGPGAVVSVGAKLGNGVIVNNLASVGHDVHIGDFAQVCPCAGISGGCEIGEGALLGTNASVIPLKKVGRDAVVGAGAVALRDVEDGQSIVRLR